MRHPRSIIPRQICNLVSVLPKYSNSILIVGIVWLSFQNYALAFTAMTYRVLPVRFTT